MPCSAPLERSSGCIRRLQSLSAVRRMDELEHQPANSAQQQAGREQRTEIRNPGLDLEPAPIGKKLASFLLRRLRPCLNCSESMGVNMPLLIKVLSNLKQIILFVRKPFVLDNLSSHSITRRILQTYTHKGIGVDESNALQKDDH